MKSRLTAVVAMTSERVIGRGGQLPWRLPADMAFFKRITTGHTVVMGRKTYESIGRPLPNRRNIVLTRDPMWSAAGVEVIRDPAELASLPDLGSRVFVIGGAEIYAALQPWIDEWLVSHVFENHPGDTFLADFETEFPNVEVVETHETFEVRRHFR